MSRDNIISFEENADTARRRIADGQARQIEMKCRGLIAHTVPRLLQDLFENLDDDLYELAGKSPQDALQNRYFDAMRDLRKLRGDIEETFLHSILQAYDSQWQHLPTANPLADLEQGEDDFALVGDDELEENLAIAGIVSKAENRYHRTLHALRIRFGHVTGQGEISSDRLPFGPTALAGYFRNSLAPWQSELPVKLLVYKLFDRHVMCYAGGLCDEINDVLVEANVLPKIVQRIRRNPVAPSVKRSRGESGQDDGKPSVDEAAESLLDTGEMLSLIGQLLSSRREGVSDRVAAQITQLPVVASHQVVNTLHQLQQESLDTMPADLDEARSMHAETTRRLALHLHMGEGKAQSRRFEQIDQDMIDVVTMLFDFILDNSGLPDAMRALLARLQIPMLRVALLDRKFLNNRDHPARKLLNSLARAVVGWVDDGDRSAEGLYGQVESVVARILTEFDDDIGLFDTVNDAFNAYIMREARGAEIAEERIAQVVRGQEQLKLARREVQNVLHSRLQAQSGIPEAVAQILEDPWKDVLLLAYLREGGGSQAWEDAVSVADKLLWTVAPKTAREERQALLKAIPELLKALRVGMANISYDQYKAANLFKALQACHIGSLRGQCVAPVKTTSSDVVAEPVVEDHMPEDASSELVRAMTVGQWLEWQMTDGGQVRGKLSWKSDVTGTYVFVSRKGLKVAEMQRHELATLFREKQAYLLDDVEKPLMDRALSAMLTALKQGGGEPAPA